MNQLCAEIPRKPPRSVLVLDSARDIGVRLPNKKTTEAVQRLLWNLLLYAPGADLCGIVTDHLCDRGVLVTDQQVFLTVVFAWQAADRAYTYLVGALRAALQEADRLQRAAWEEWSVA